MVCENDDRVRLFYDSTTSCCASVQLVDHLSRRRVASSACRQDCNPGMEINARESAYSIERAKPSRWRIYVKGSFLNFLLFAYLIYTLKNQNVCLRCTRSVLFWWVVRPSRMLRIARPLFCIDRSTLNLLFILRRKNFIFFVGKSSRTLFFRIPFYSAK